MTQDELREELKCYVIKKIYAFYRGRATTETLSLFLQIFLSDYLKLQMTLKLCKIPNVIIFSI